MKTTRVCSFGLFFLALLSLLIPSARGQNTAGYALSFNQSSSNYVSIPSLGSLSGTFTVEMWVKLNALPPASIGACFMASREPQEYGFDVKYVASSSLLHADIGTGTGWMTTSADATVTLPTNEWHHVAYVITPTSYTIYLDGLQTASGTYPAAAPVLFDANHTLSLARTRSGLQEYLTGEMDEVRVWNVARTGAEISANKNHALQGNETGLVQYYRFDEGEGSIISDSAAAGGFSTGNLVNAPVFVPSGVDPFSTLAILAPTVSTLDVTSITGASSQLLLGKANPNATNASAWFEWGTTTNYGNTTPAEDVGNGTAYTNFDATITGLSKNMTYHFRAVASNALGTVTGVDKTFSINFVASVETLGVVSLTQSSLRLEGVANPAETNLTAWFEWGTTTNYGTTTSQQNLGSGPNGVAFSVVLTNLATNTTYHFRAVGSNVLGLVTGADKIFSIDSLPFVETLGALTTDNSSVRLGGTANPTAANMTTWFEWGTTTNYGNIATGTNLGSGTNNVDFDGIITNTIANTTYHFRAVASNALGVVVLGRDKTFPIVPPLLAIDRQTNVFLSWQKTTPAFLLEQSTNLSSTNWTTLYGATVSNDFYQVAAPTTNTTFYRLRQLVNGPITPIIWYTGDGAPGDFVAVTVCPILDDGDYYGCVLSRILVADFPSSFYATAIVDPNRRPNDPAPAFHWEIFFPEAEGGMKYTCAGISGYFAPILTIQPNALPNIPGPLIDPAVQWKFRLTVTHRSSDPLSTGTEDTVIGFRVRYAGSQLTETDVSQCQDPNGSHTGCTDASLPTTEPN